MSETLAVMVDGQWVISLITAGIAAVAAGLISYSKGRTAGVQLQAPVPEVPIRKLVNYATVYELDQVREHVLRVEAGVESIRSDQAAQFKDLLETGSARENRFFDRLDAGLRAVHERLDEFVIHPSPPAAPTKSKTTRSR